MAAILGITAKHAIITPVCRANRTPEGAFEEAVRRLKEEYDICRAIEGNEDVNYHLVLTVERP